MSLPVDTGQSRCCVVHVDRVQLWASRMLPAVEVIFDLVWAVLGLLDGREQGILLIVETLSIAHETRQLHSLAIRWFACAGGENSIASL